MRRILLAFGLAFTAPTAFAASIVCTGNYMVYSIEARTKSTNTSVSAPIIVTANGPFGSSHQVRLDAESSDVRVGQYIHVVGKSSEGAGSLTAAFVGGSTYQGTLDAQTSFGNVQVNATCTMSNPWITFR